MKKHALWILVVFGLLAVNPAAAWFWEKDEVNPPPVAAEVKKEGREAAAPVQEKGFWAGVAETGRDIGRYFRGVGKEAKESAKEVPGEAKKEGQLVGRSFKESGKELGKDLKKGGKAVGQGVKDIGRDFKEAGKSVFVDEQEESGK